MKLHVGCGDIYLKGYVNIDVVGDLAAKVTEKELKENETTLNSYFKYPFGSPRRKIIVDKRINLLKKWPFKDDSVSKIVMISCIEHFEKKDALFVIGEVKRILKRGGVFLVDFPDLEKQYKKYYKKDPEFFMELVYCNHKNKYSIHHWGYTTETFKKMIGSNFLCIKKQVVKHAYPMTGIKAVKLYG